MQGQRKQSSSGTEKKGKTVALAMSKINLGPPDMRPGSPQGNNKNSHSGKDDDAANCPPIRQQVDIIIVGAVGALLDDHGAIFGKTIIKMRRPHAEPEIIQPHFLARPPKRNTSV